MFIFVFDAGSIILFQSLLYLYLFIFIFNLLITFICVWSFITSNHEVVFSMTQSQLSLTTLFAHMIQLISSFANKTLQFCYLFDLTHIYYFYVINYSVLNTKSYFYERQKFTLMNVLNCLHFNFNFDVIFIVIRFNF